MFVVTFADGGYLHDKCEGKVLGSSSDDLLNQGSIHVWYLAGLRADFAQLVLAETDWDSVRCVACRSQLVIANSGVI